MIFKKNTFEENIYKEAKGLYRKLEKKGYFLDQLLGGCHKARDDFMDIVIILVTEIDKKYHWITIRKIIIAIAELFFLNQSFQEPINQTSIRHLVVDKLFEQFDKVNIGHDKFVVPSEITKSLNFGEIGIERCLRRALAYCLVRTIFSYNQSDIVYLEKLCDLLDNEEDKFLQEDIFKLLTEFKETSGYFLSKLTCSNDNQAFVLLFFSKNYIFDTLSPSVYIDVLEGLKAHKNKEIRLMVNNIFPEVQEKVFIEHEQSKLFTNFDCKEIFINPRLAKLSPEFINKKHKVSVVQTLIALAPTDYYWLVWTKIFNMLGERWTNSDNLRYEVLDFLFVHFSNKFDSEYVSDFGSQFVKKPDFAALLQIKSNIAIAILAWIKPKNEKDRALYLEKLKIEINNSKNLHSRYSLFKAYIRLGEGAVTEELIGMIGEKDNSLHQAALEEIRRLKPIEAQSKLEQFISSFGREYDFHKDIAQSALRAIKKSQKN